MVRSHLIASSLILPAVLAAGLYPKDGPVLNLDARSYNTLIASSNHTSIVEFYAPWCGHCKNLKPDYEKAAKSLAGLAKVGAVNCDAEENKPFCGSMEVKGFPTLKIVRANPKRPGGRPIVEDYQGQRSAKAIVDAVTDKIPNHVARPKSGELDAFVASAGAKAVLFTNKGAISPLLKSLAIDYLGVINFAQIRDKDTAAVEQYSVTKYPTLILFQDRSSEPTTFQGEVKREAILEFLKTVAEPNPDPPKKASNSKSKSKTNKSKASKDSSSLSKASASQASSEASNAKPSQKAETIVDDENPIPSVDPKISNEKPIKVPKAAPALASLSDEVSLQQKCLNDKASTCVLLLLPEFNVEDPHPEQALKSLSEIQAKHEGSGRKLFPFYQLPDSNSQARDLRKSLSLGSGVEILAVNGKRGWWRQYSGTGYAQETIDDWIDAIRMGEGAKQKLPSGVVRDASELPQQVKIEAGGTESLKDSLKAQMPAGVNFDFEELDDAKLEQLMKEHEKGKSDSKLTHEEL